MRCALSGELDLRLELTVQVDDAHHAGASVANAAGVAITKLDHTRNEKIPPAQRRRDWLRPLWLLGLGLYVISQLVGSTLALEYMEAA